MIELIHCDKYVKLTGHYRPGMVGLDNYVSVDYSCCIFDLHTALTEHDLFPYIVNPRQGLLVLTVLSQNLSPKGPEMLSRGESDVVKMFIFL